MKRITLAVALLTLTLPAMAVAQGSHSGSPPAAPSAETEKFVHTAANANAFEIQSSQICRQPHPSSAIIDAVENGDVDVAVVWGPVAGYFAAQGSTLLAIEPVQPWRDGTELPMAFYISMGARRGDHALLQRLNDSL